MKRSVQLLSFVAVIAVATMANAVPLTDLMRGGTLQQGDKIFDHFGWSGSVGPQGVNITGIGNGEGNDINSLYGILISGGGLANLPAGSVGAVVLTYSVATAPGSGMLISDIHQRVGADGSGYMSLQAIEWAFNGSGEQVAISTVGNFNGRDYIDPPAELNDILNLAEPLQRIWIQKQISWQVLSVAEGSTISIRVKQQFSQVAVPDGGATVMLLGLAVSGLGIFARKRSK